MRKQTVRHAPPPQRGFSLVEIMVASVIGLVLLGGVVQIVTAISSGHREVTRAGQLLENGRYAVQLLTHEIEHAGYYDQFDAPAEPSFEPNPCATDLATLVNDMGVPIQGFDAQAASFARPTCVPAAAYKAGTDILVVRRASTIPATTLSGTEYYLQSRFDDYILAQGADAASFTLTNPMDTTTLPVRRYRVDLYFISRCRDMSDGACQDAIPTLMRMELGPGPGFTPVALVEGVEDLQLYFGVDMEPAGEPDGAPDEIGGQLYVSDPGDLGTAAGRTAWANVVSVQLYLLSRDVRPVLDYEDEKTYVLSPADASTPYVISGGNTHYNRHVFATQVRVVNSSSRRET